MVTGRQRRLYASAPHDEYAREALSLYHPGFSQDWHLTNWFEGFDGRVEDVEGRARTVAFLRHPFKVNLPEIVDSGNYDMTLTLFNSGPEFIAQINSAAAQNDVPVRAEYRAFLDANDVSQIRPIRLTLLSLSAEGNAVTARAGIPDIVNRPFPSRNYTADLFRGLDRA